MNIIKLECMKLKNKVLLMILVMLFVYIFIAVLNLHSYAYDYQLQVWEKAGEFFDLIFPLLIMLLVGDMVYEDKKNNFILYIGNRIEVYKYLKYKKVGCILCASYMIFCVSFLSFVITQFIFPEVASVTYNTRNFEHVWIECYGRYPVIYVTLLCLWRCILAAVIVNFGFELSKVLTNKVLIIVTPFMVVLFLHFLLAILNVPAYSIIYSFDPSTLSSKAINFITMAAGPVLYLVLSLAVKIIGVLYEKCSISSKKDIF